MATRETKIPSIPDVPDNLSEDMASFLSAIKEGLEIREGRADPLDRTLLRRDLSKIGIDVNSLIKDPASYSFSNFIPNDNDDHYAKFTPTGLSKKTFAEVLADLSGEATAAFNFNSQALTGVASLTLPNSGWAGIGPALERLEFYTAGYAAFMGCKVGIEVVPSQALHVHSTDGVRIAITDDTTGITATDGGYLQQTGVDSAFINQETGDMAFGVDNSVDMTILTGGNVGINETNPVAKLHVDQAVDDAAIPTLILDQADISEGFINFIGSDRGVITGATDSLKSVRVELGGVIYRLALYVDA